MFIHHHGEGVLRPFELPQEVVHPLRLGHHRDLAQKAGSSRTPPSRAETRSTASTTPATRSPGPKTGIRWCRLRAMSASTCAREASLATATTLGRGVMTSRTSISSSSRTPRTIAASSSSRMPSSAPVSRKAATSSSEGVLVWLVGEREPAAQQPAERFRGGARQSFPGAEPGQQARQQILGIAEQDDRRGELPEDEPGGGEDAEDPEAGVEPSPSPSRAAAATTAAASRPKRAGMSTASGSRSRSRSARPSSAPSPSARTAIWLDAKKAISNSAKRTTKAPAATSASSQRNVTRALRRQGDHEGDRQ